MKNIGIIIPSKESGGVWQLAEVIERGLKKVSDFQIEIVRVERKSFGKRLFCFLCVGKNYFPQGAHFDLLIFPTPFSGALPHDTPFIVMIPDLMYKYYPQFPEYRFFKRIKRNISYGRFAKRALFCIVDSEQGKNDLNRFLKVPKERIRAIPYIPPSYVFEYREIKKEEAEEVLASHTLPEHFIFYPAQLWYHKNHLRLIKSINLIKENYGVEVSLVLTGSVSGEYQRNYQKIRELAKNLKIEKQIIHLGYVSEKEIVALYKKSTALVFPSLIGPTSIPPLEAMVLGIPVLCSNLFEMPKQINNAGLLFDPFNIEDIADKIYKVWTDENLRQELIRKGYERTKELTLENYAQKWERVIKEALKIYEEKRH